MAVGHAGRPDPETVRRSVPSAWPGSWAGSADSSGTTQLSTSIFHFPVEAGEFYSRSGYSTTTVTVRTFFRLAPHVVQQEAHIVATFFT